MGCNGETWYVGSGGHKYYQQGVLSLNVHNTVKMVIFAGVIFRASAIFDIFACF